MELIETLSDPALSSARMSSIVRIPPPTVRGIKITSAVRRTTSSMMSRPSWLAVISKNTSSSAPSSSYRAATSTGSPASRRFTKFVPLTTRPRLTSRQGITRFANIFVGCVKRTFHLGMVKNGCISCTLRRPILLKISTLVCHPTPVNTPRPVVCCDYCLCIANYVERHTESESSITE